jgi:NAD(P)-dependent dehydrogenase (short-subunit alcohol dehydrogenase family)
MPTVLIIGATRGLGASLANAYAAHEDTTIFGTTRSATPPKGLHKDIVWIPHIDVSESSVGSQLVSQLGSLGPGAGMPEGGVNAFDIVVCLYLRLARMGG